MEQVKRKPLIKEEDAATRLKISTRSLRCYVRRKRIPAIVRALPARHGGGHRYEYEFTPQALDVFEEERSRGKKKRGGFSEGRRLRKDGVTDEDIRQYLDGTTLSFEEIGRIVGISRERVHQLNDRLGAKDGGTRARLRKEENARAKNQEHWDKFLRDRPSWYRAFQDWCGAREIVFKPYGRLHGRALRFSYEEALCNEKIVHLHHGTFRIPKGNSLDYVPVNAHTLIPEDHFFAVVGVKEKCGEDQFHFWIVPGSVMHTWQEEWGNRYYCLAPFRQVRRRFGYEGYEDTRSRWAEWYERWDLLGAVGNDHLFCKG